MSEERCHRNALALCLTRSELKHLQCCSKGAAGELLVPCLNGDTHAVGYGQTAHLAVVLRCSRLRLRDFVSLRGRPPRSPSLVAGLLIDDLVLLDFVRKELPRQPSLGAEVIHGYEAAGLPRHAGKAVHNAPRGDFWGEHLDGELGLLRPNHKRVVPLASLLVRVVRAEVCCGSLLEALTGALVSALQMKRRLLSLLDAVYAEQRGREPNDAFAVRGNLASELLCFAALLCLSEADLRAPACPGVVCSDASSAKEAAVRAPLPPELSVEFCRHGLQKGLWNRLLGEVPAYLRERGEQDLGCRELPETTYEHHPLWERLCTSLQFESLGPCVQAGKRRHINVGEVRAALRAEGSVGQRWPGCRFLQLLDSQVATACLVKGRSSSRSLNRELRRSLPDHFTQLTHLSDDPTPCENPASLCRRGGNLLLRATLPSLTVGYKGSGFTSTSCENCLPSPSSDPTPLFPFPILTELGDITERLLLNGCSAGPLSLLLTFFFFSTGCLLRSVPGMRSNGGVLFSRVGLLCTEVSSGYAKLAATSLGPCKPTASTSGPSALN